MSSLTGDEMRAERALFMRALFADVCFEEYRQSRDMTYNEFLADVERCFASLSNEPTNSES